MMFQKNLEKTGAAANPPVAGGGSLCDRTPGTVWLPLARELYKFKEQGEDRVDEGRGEDAFGGAVFV